MTEKFEFLSSSAEQKKSEREKLEEYYAYLKPFLEVFASHNVPDCKVDPKAETFAFNHQEGEIVISPRFIESLDLNREEQKYILLHEVSHLIQLFQNPEAYLESFEIPQEKAKEFPPELKPFLEKAWHNFFNVFFDIHANSIICQRHPLYQKEERFEKLPESLYQQKTFPEDDYSEKPFSQQFLTYLLRKAMVRDQAIKVSPEVAEKLQKETHFFGKKYNNLEEFVQNHIFSSQKDIKDIMYILKTFLMADYEELLKKDIESGKIKLTPSCLGKLNMDDDLKSEVIKKIADEIKDMKKSAKEKMADYSKNWLDNWAKEKGFSEEERERILKIREKTFKTISDLEDLWYNFVQKSIEMKIKEMSGFKTGIAINPESLIQQLPVLLTQPSEAKIFNRISLENKIEAIKPKKITVFLIVDLSGSMDDEKRKAVQEVGYAILKSLINFQRAEKMENPDFPIEINYRIIGFGDSLKELIFYDKKLRKKEDAFSKDLDEELLKGILAIEKIDLGGTQDDKALSLVKEDFSPELEKDLASDNEVVVVLEITDGETATMKESKQLVKELNSKRNVYCRAIQIPGSVYSEKTEREKIKDPPSELIPKLEKLEKKVLPPTGTFKKVWGEKWGKRLENLNILKQTIVTILYDVLERKIN